MKSFSKLCCLGLVLSSLHGQAFAAKPKPLAGSRPNLVLIIADDVSANDLGCYGNPTVRTPHLDKLAAKGQRWTRGYLTASVCSPSRCSMISGRYPHNSGAPELHTVLPEGQPLFPLQLKKAGYWCAQAGKWHMGDYPHKAFDKTIEDKKENGESGCRQWVPLLRERPKNKPFFLWLASFDAHREWQPDADGKPHDPKKIRLPESLLDTASTRTDLAAYHNEVQRLDRYVGEVVKELKTQGVLDNTVVLFISDNGRPFPRAKRWNTEEGSRIPWIMHWPAGLSGAGKTCDQLASVIDIAPSFLELAGAKIPAAIQGRSLLAQIADPKAKVCDYVFAERNWQVEYCHERMLRHGEWSYYRNAAPELAHFGFVNATFYKMPAYADVWRHFREGKSLTPVQKTIFQQPRPTEQMFNLNDDPMEINDLAGSAEHQDTLEKLRSVMDQWIKQTDDTVPSSKRRTPDRMDRLTGKRLYEGFHPGPSKYEVPGQSSNATTINHPGPR